MEVILKSGMKFFIFHDILQKNSYPEWELKTTMTDKLKVKARIARGDGSVAPHHVSGNAKTSDHKPVPGEGKVEPHDRESEVTTSVEQEKLTCPRCGKSTLRAEFPDHYEAWIKCSSCGFFMGMSNEEWHRMENSPNIIKSIRKMAVERKLL
jgi:ribosomal protein S27AE